MHNLPALTPAIPDVVSYLRSAAPKYEGDWSTVGTHLIHALDIPIVKRSEYLQLVILSLFGRIADLNHFNELAGRFHGAPAFARREIVLAARCSGAKGWLESQASSIAGRDPWEARAVLFAADALPSGVRSRVGPDTRDAAPPVLDRVLFERLQTESVMHRREPRKGDGAITPRVGFSLDVKVKRAQDFDEEKFRRRMKDGYRAGYLQYSRRNDTFSLSGRSPQFELLVRDAAAGHLDALVRACGGVRLLNVRTKPGGEYVYDFIRQITTRPGQIKSISSSAAGKELARCDVLLVTTTAIERDVLLTYLQPCEPGGAILEASVGRVTYRIGRFGIYRSAYVETRMGSQDRQGAALTVFDAIARVKPKAVLILGIAFGVDPAKQRLGDVLVADSVIPYELQKRGPETAVDRGIPLTAGGTLSERFRSRASDWVFRRYDGRARILSGPVLSGEKLVNNREFRDELLAAFPTAVGGEMEGIGAYAAANRLKTEMILLKGICDWADGHKNDVAQPFAAHAAVSLAQHVLLKEDVLLELGAKEN